MKTPKTCVAHRAHRPKTLTYELHHVIPVAWQLAYVTIDGADLHHGTDQAGRGALWDARTLSLCPTGHRNVHAILVGLVHGTTTKQGARSERAIASMALERMLAATGIDAPMLLARRLYGNA